MKKRLTLIVLMAGLGLALHAQGEYRDRYRRNLDEKYTSGLFRGAGAYMLIPPDDPSAIGALTVFQYLQGRIPGVMINNTYPYSPTVRWRMASTTLYLNEVRVDAGTLASVNMNDIALIKVFRPPFLGAPGGGSGGAIAVYTLQGEDEGEQ